MRIRKPLAACAAALALWAGSSNKGWGQPRPPGPPMLSGGGGPSRPVMGPMGGAAPPRGISGPGGIGGPGGSPGAIRGLGQPGGFGPGGISGPGGAGSLSRPGSIAVAHGPPGGIAVPLHPSGGLGGPERAGGTGGPGSSPGLGGLGSLARSGASAGKSSTAAVNPQALAREGNLVRNNFQHYDSFRGDWWDRHRGAWRSDRWATAAAAYYGSANWAVYYGYCGYATTPVYYDYGSTVVYEGNNVYINGDAAATQEQYAQQARTIAGTGKQTQAGEDEEWLSLGVFAMTQGQQATGNDLFQLAVNKSGVLRGNYYNALSDSTLPVYGSVDQKSQRAAWTVGDRQEPVFEAGFANLAKPETTMLVHFGKERTEQWTLVRMEQSAEPK